MYDTSLFTINGEKVYETFKKIEEGIEIPMLCDENGTKIDSFIEYDIAGNPHEKYKTVDTPTPVYTIYVCGGTEYKIPIAEDISGTKIIIPECDFPLPPQYASKEDADEYKFTCWRDEDYQYFYFPGTTFLIPDRNITLYAVWTKNNTINPNSLDNNIVYSNNNIINKQSSNQVLYSIIGGSAVVFVLAIIVLAISRIRKKKGGIPTKSSNPHRRGFDMIESNRQKEKICPKCRHRNLLDARFCENCGSAFEKS